MEYARGEVESVGLLVEPRWELIPLKGVESQISSLPRRSIVTVTCSPTKGIWATVELAEKIVQAGHSVVPHLSARMVESEFVLRSVLHRLGELGVREAFIVGGDQAKPLGPYHDSFSLLQALRGLESSLQRLGVTGYPEGHPKIGDDVLMADLQRKKSLADYVVTQMCFDARRVGEWVRRLRTDGVLLPVYVGIPGAVDLARLTRTAGQIGVGASLRFLKGNYRAVARLASGYRPTELVKQLQEADVQGVHIYTFNRVKETEAWRRSVQ